MVQVALLREAAVQVLIAQVAAVQMTMVQVTAVVQAAADTPGSAGYCRHEDRGALLFITSMSAVKTTADACRQVCLSLKNGKVSLRRLGRLGCPFVAV